MSNSPPMGALPPEIRSLLRRLRWRIRAYVWLEGLSLAIVWLGLTFWVGLALDYLPVLAGIGEMPRTARLVLLTVIAAVFAYILYRYLFRRLFARLADRSMALLLERRFAEFGDGLITSVELTDSGLPPTEAAREMLMETERDALERVRSVRLSEVFNFRPLAISMTSALLLVLAIGGFYVVNASAFELGMSRLYLLRDDTWPRNARIEVVGVEVRQTAATQSDGELVPFQDNSLKAAKGANLSLLVRADAAQPVVPEICSIQYETQEGDRGRVNMTRVGRIRDGFQYYKYDGKPFDGILSNIRFDVVGFDHRVSGYGVEVVDSPTVVEVQVACEFPPYLVDPDLSQWLPRTVEYTSGLQLPQGTKLILQCRSNKPLQRIDLVDADSLTNAVVMPDTSEPSQTYFVHPVANLGDHLTLDVTLTDTDSVQSERPFRIHISGIEDLPPTIDMRLRGIGSAVTPNVMIPAQGKITDDYAVNESWVELVVNDQEPKKFPFQTAGDGEAKTAIDFQSERSRPEGTVLQPTNKLTLTIMATDKRDLGSGPNEALGDRYELEVVPPEQLLTLLESRELGLRRRFEQIIDEMTQTRDMLLRIKSDGPEAVSQEPVEPDESELKEKADGVTNSGLVPDELKKFERAWSLRLLRARQALMQSQKSAQEVLGVAISFRDIREELINNRVDTEDRKQRLQEQIADPLQRIGEEQFPELDKRLEKLAQILGQIEQKRSFKAEDPQAVAAAQETIDQANQILRELEGVLQKMLDLESFNELLDIVRSLIDEQESLMNETKKQQKKAVLDLLK